MNEPGYDVHAVETRFDGYGVHQFFMPFSFVLVM
jgi:hypothetical protein